MYVLCTFLDLDACRGAHGCVETPRALPIRTGWWMADGWSGSMMEKKIYYCVVMLH